MKSATTQVSQIEIPIFESAALSAIAKNTTHIVDLTRGPTGSWKDFSARAAVLEAVKLGHDRIVVVSSGNGGLAIATAAHANNMKARVLTYTDTPVHVTQTLIKAGATVEIHPTRAALYAALNVHIKQGWFSATLTNEARLKGCPCPGAIGFFSISQAIDRVLPKMVQPIISIHEI